MKKYLVCNGMVEDKKNLQGLIYIYVHEGLCFVMVKLGKVLVRFSDTPWKKLQREWFHPGSFSVSACKKVGVVF